ncbi:thioredoxin [Aureibacter tunicatorum]|uniref:Thioredoxin n=1 Tax=Aureibacter tunicatorum TaxID=866807 RepID=A0AAE3XPZ0_9BACT|nr:thioredoxin [Aureibacter tunicatorum]MDR6240992.1 thioredoxin 1 [Aureibacter tunicatorum]BDD03771.1 thioredoxin [Aureibacter tunicatorum]
MSEIKILTRENFEETLKSEASLVIDFWAPWCGPCQMMSPVLDEASQELEGNGLIAKLNVDDYPDIASMFKIRSIPTLVYLKGGKVVDQTIGLVGKEELLSKLKN